MGGAGESLAFIPVRIAILTVSDTRTADNDRSGDLLAKRVEDAGHVLADRAIVKDERDLIVARLRQWIGDPEIDAVIATGGTGLTERDVTPEAFRSVYEKEMEGFSAVFHRLSYEKVGTSTVQSRASAGLAGGTWLFSLPGSPGACADGWDGILSRQLDSRHQPCNLVEISPHLIQRR